MVMWLYDWEPHTLGQHAVNPDGSRHCGSGDKTILICHVISKDHVFKGLYDFVGGSSLN